MKKIELLIALSSIVTLVPGLSFGMISKCPPPTPTKEVNTSQGGCIKYEEKEKLYVITNKAGERIYTVKNLKELGFSLEVVEDNTGEKPKKTYETRYLILERTDGKNKFTDVFDLIDKKCLLCMSLVQDFYRPDKYMYHDRREKYDVNPKESSDEFSVMCRKESDDEKKSVRFCFNKLGKFDISFIRDIGQLKDTCKLLSVKCAIGDDVFDLPGDNLEEVNCVELSKEGVKVDFRTCKFKIYKFEKDQDKKAKLSEKPLFEGRGSMMVSDSHFSYRTGKYGHKYHKE